MSAGGGAEHAPDEHTLQLATAVLLVEVMRSDAEISPDERATVVAGLRDHFALSVDEVDLLVEQAHRAVRESTDFFQFTSRINDSFGMQQKIHIVELMWRVAYADGTLTAHENHVMRRIGDLLHVPHGAYANAKMRAQQGSSVA